MEDDRDSQALLELKEKHDGTKYMLQVLMAQAQSLEQRQKRVEVMTREIEAVPENSNLYKNIGKAYFISTKPEILDELKAVSGLAVDELKTIDAKREHATKVLKQTQDEIRELVGAAVSKSGPSSSS